MALPWPRVIRIVVATWLLPNDEVFPVVVCDDIRVPSQPLERCLVDDPLLPGRTECEAEDPLANISCDRSARFLLLIASMIAC